MLKRIITLTLLFTLLLTAALPALAAPASLPAAIPHLDDGYAMLDAVNLLRASYGLAPYRTSVALMISTQLHSIYQASIGTWSHEDADGTDETARAAIQGYGNGAAIYCDEAVGFGYNYTAQQMVDAQGRIFYTLDAGYYSSESAVVYASSAENLQPQTDGFATATPQPDGSIIHEVVAGESFFSIADDYGLTVNALLELNSLTLQSFLNPGDLLLVRPAFTPTITPTTTLTPTPVFPTATRRPTRTATLSPQSSPTPLPSPTPTPQPWFRTAAAANLMGRMLPALAVVLGTTGIILVIAGSVLKRRR